MYRPWAGLAVLAIVLAVPGAEAQNPICYRCQAILDEGGGGTVGCKTDNNGEKNCTTTCDSTGCDCEISGGSCDGFADVRMELTGDVMSGRTLGVEHLLALDTHSSRASSEAEALKGGQTETYLRDCGGRIIHRSYTPIQAAAKRRLLTSIRL